MPGRLRAGSAMTRRRFLTTVGSATAVGLTTSIKAPALVWSAQRPSLLMEYNQAIYQPIQEWYGHVRIDQRAC